jgi:hypothetical protein
MATQTIEQVLGELKQAKIELESKDKAIVDLQIELDRVNALNGALLEQDHEGPECESGPYIELKQDAEIPHIWRGWAEGSYGYEVHHGFEMDHTYKLSTILARAGAKVSQAFEHSKLGPLDPKSGDPDFSTWPPFAHGNKLCVKVWVEGADAEAGE